VDPRAGLDASEKRKFLTLPGLELRPLSRPARSESLYRLRYPGSLESVSTFEYALSMDCRQSVRLREHYDQLV
jgi:hypothetical protein